MTNFTELGLAEPILRALQTQGYTQPTPIQTKAIPVALSGDDILGIAQTGTGKTASFVLPMLTLLEKGRARARMPRTLILEPTRELAAQVEQSFEIYGQNHRLTVALLIGGVSFADQLKKLDRGADVLIATPGRLLDHFERGKLLLNAVDTFVVDEADRMLDMGFIPDIERICKMLPPSRQTVFFSATMPSEIQSLVDQFLRNPERIEVAPPSSTAKTITQGIVASGNKPWEKRSVLRNLLTDAKELQNAIVFCNRKRDVATLFRSLNKHGFNAGALHGDMDQTSRMATLDKFKSGELSILVASDVAARGLDIPTVSHVFNFDLPTHAEDYVHRIGRTGRAGREGVALSIATRNDTKYLDAIEKLIDEKIAWQGDGSFPEQGEEDEESGKSRKGSRNSRRGRSGKKDKDSAAPREARERKESTASSEASEERKPRGRKERPERHNENPEGGSRNRTPQGRGRRGRDRDDKQVIGMGDHVPAFLLAPIRPPKRKAKKSESKSAE